MRLSRLFGTRLKEAPPDAPSPGQGLLLRGGYLRFLDRAITLLPPGERVAQKIEGLLTGELDRLGGQRIRMGKNVASGGSDLLTICRHELSSHAQLPLMLYDYRIRRSNVARGGSLLESRVENILEAFALDHDHLLSIARVEALRQALLSTFERMGLSGVVSPFGDPGLDANALARDLIFPCEFGSDRFFVSESGHYLASDSIAEGHIPAFAQPALPLEKVHTPGTKTIRDLADFLRIEPRQTAKAVFYESEREGRLVLVLIRGDREVNESKVIRSLPPEAAFPLKPATEETIRAAGLEPGFASPIGADPRRVCILIDHTVRESNNLVTGANEPDYHYVNFNLMRDLPGAATFDLVQAEEGDPSPAGDGALALRRGIRLGAVKWLGAGPAEHAGVTFNDASGATRHPFAITGEACIESLLAAVAETHHDKFGPKWPAPLAPWQVHLCALKLDAPVVREAAETLERELESSGIEVLYDDRNARPGVQFAEADLLGAPVRLVLGEKLKEGQIEWKRRDTGEQGTLPLAEVVPVIRSWLVVP